MWRSRLAWALVLTFFANTTCTYVLFAWLPEILADAGLGADVGGRWLAVFAILGLPASLVSPGAHRPDAQPVPAGRRLRRVLGGRAPRADAGARARDGGVDGPARHRAGHVPDHARAHRPAVADARHRRRALGDGAGARVRARGRRAGGHRRPARGDGLVARAVPGAARAGRAAAGGGLVRVPADDAGTGARA